MLRFEGEKNLKSWLTASDTGKAILKELILKEKEKEKDKDDQKRRERPRKERPKIVAVQHSDHVKLYCTVPCSLYVTTQIHSEGVSGQGVAERILEQSLPASYRKVLWPGRPTEDRGGYLGEVSNRKLTIQEYEWWEAYRENAKAIDNANSVTDTSKDGLRGRHNGEEGDEASDEGLARIRGHNSGAPEGSGGAGTASNVDDKCVVPC